MNALRACLRRVLWLGVLVAAISTMGCAGAGDDGIGGTGVQASTDGIGGTGAPVAGVGHDPDGIGGTGIVGEITALGSVVVNGLRIELPPGLAVARNGLQATTHSLAPGQVVAVVAGSRGAGLEARSIEVLDALIGPVTTTADTTGRLEVLGQILPMERMPDGLQAGERVRIAGFWRPGGSLDMTRIERASPLDPDLVLGPVTVEQGALRVGGIQVLGVGIQAQNPGEHVRVIGTASGRAIWGSAVHATPFGRLRGQVTRLVVEGYPGLVAAGQVRLGPVSAVLKPASSVEAPLRRAAVSGRRVVVDAQVLGTRTEIRRVRPVAPLSPRSVPSRRIDAVPETPSAALPERPERPERVERPTKPQRPTRLERPRDTRPVDVRPVDIRPVDRTTQAVGR